MLPIIILVLISTGLYFLYGLWRLRRAVAFVRQAPDQTGEFFVGKKSDKKLSVLLIGDSIAAGTGIENFNESVGGRLAEALAKKRYVHLVNKARLGAKITDLALDSYEGQWDLVVVIAGSNDLIRRASLAKVKTYLKLLIKKVKPLAPLVLLIGPGDVAGAKLFPLWMRIGMDRKQNKMAGILADAADEKYVLYANPLKYSNSPDYFAKDGLHPNSAGHNLWFRIIWDKISDRF